jgi:hypothetical protein
MKTKYVKLAMALILGFCIVSCAPKKEEEDGSSTSGTSFFPAIGG